MKNKQKGSKKLIAESISVHPWWESNSYLLHHKGRASLREQDTGTVESQLGSGKRIKSYGLKGSKASSPSLPIPCSITDLLFDPGHGT